MIDAETAKLVCILVGIGFNKEQIKNVINCINSPDADCKFDDFVYCRSIEDLAKELVPEIPNWEEEYESLEECLVDEVFNQGLDYVKLNNGQYLLIL